MKNSKVTNLWNEYKSTLSENTIRKTVKLEQSIEKFEQQGYQLEIMSRQESKILSKIIGENISYNSNRNYCCVLNGFLRLYEERYNTKCEKCYVQKIKSNENLYYSEDELIDDIEEHIADLVNELSTQRNISDDLINELEDSYLSPACMLILRWYGITIAEMCNIKKEDIIGNKIILPNREKLISDRAIKYIERYKNKIAITHFWRYPINHNLPNVPYLFRREGIKKTDDINEPLTLNLVAVSMHRFMKDSGIKKYISLSGAFYNIPEKTSDPINLVKRVHEYIGDEVMSDISIRKSWIGYIEGF